MIVIYETYANGDIHVPFNAGLIETAALAFPNEIIRLYGETTHLQQIRSYLKDRLRDRLEFCEIDFPKQKGSNVNYAQKIYKGLQRIKQETPKGSLLIMSYVTAVSLALLKFSQHFNKHFCGVQIVVHGNLADIDGWRSRNPLFKHLNLRGALSFFNLPHLRYLVLEEAIARELLHRIPTLKPFIDVFPHPLPDDQPDTPSEINGLGLPVTIGYLGLVTRLKGFPVFKEVAKILKPRLGNKVSFRAIGHTKGRPLDEDMDCLDVKPQTSTLNREEFTRLAAGCHFICLPYSGKMYSLSASGTLLDAIALKKPIIALDVPVTRDLFTRYGDIGYLCATPEDICKTIEEIVLTIDPERYKRQQAAIAKVLLDRQPAELATIYLKITQPLKKPIPSHKMAVTPSSLSPRA